jgi:hypothetical protein
MRTRASLPSSANKVNGKPAWNGLDRNEKSAGVRFVGSIP